MVLGLVGVVLAETVRTSIRSYIAEPFYVPSGSMEPALQVGDYFMVNKRAYRERSPQVGDVIVFRRPGEPADTFVSRILAGPGRSSLRLGDFAAAGGQRDGDRSRIEPTPQGELVDLPGDPRRR